MNKLVLTTSFILFGILSLMAQIPSGLNFQGIARADDGEAIINESIIVQIDILDNSNGVIDYSESHNLITDDAGLFSLIIGSGEVQSGDYQGLEWSISRDVSVGIDISADGSFDVEFTTPFHSVPYANYAKYAENVDDADADPTNEIQTISINSTEISLSNGGSIVLPADQVNDADADPSNEIQTISINSNQISLTNGGSIVLPTDQVNDADADPSNEIQTISINSNQISLTNGGSIILPTDQVNDADADPSNEIQSLSINDHVLSISGGNSVQLSQSSVIVGAESVDVPTSPSAGQLYFDETNNRFYVYHAEGWTEIELGATVDDIYNQNTDSDNDGILDANDNCPNSSNPDQSNIDSDAFGDVCDTDIDGDGIINQNDDCPQDYNPNQTDTDLDGCEDEDETGLHPAFAEFSTDAYTIFLDGNEVVIETNGLPNHGSPYWSDSHPLNIDPVCTNQNAMAPGNIDNFNGSFTLIVPENPQLASSSTSTGLGPIGLAISGSVIYNDEEGPNIPLDNAVVSLDCNGAHTGPQSYHYHLEPVSWSQDDENLIGIMSDGFFLYGRRNYDGQYPTDLDESGGHFGPTPHNADGEYHYHIQNELYLNQYYILFPGDYQGTPNGIGN